MRLGIPQVLGLIILALFLPWVLLTGKSERDIRRTLEGYEQFSRPSFEIKFSPVFSPRLQWDPLGFMGQGAQAGFWKWTPDRLELTEQGRQYFSDNSSEIASLVGAGHRRVSGIHGFKDAGNRRQVDFQYQWTEITPPAKALLSRAPQLGAQYEGHAVLVNEAGNWRVERLETPAWDRPLALLKDTVAGVKR